MSGTYPESAMPESVISSERHPVIFAGKRTVIGSAGHGLKDQQVDALAAAVLSPIGALLAGYDLSVDEVILGNCWGPGGNPARVAALRAGLGIHVPGMTVDRQCGSGLEAIVQAGARVSAGLSRVVIAGGAESASTAPWRFWPPAEGQNPVRYTQAPFAPEGFPDPAMGVAADDLARELGISRERQDAWATRSHQRAWEAQQAGRFRTELVSVGALDRDERIRPGITVERLRRFRPAFVADGTVTAGNSCGISDGAAAVAVGTAKDWAVTRLPGLRLCGSIVTAGDPSLPGLAPIAAVEQLLAHHAVKATDLQAVEITEAFASQVITVVDALGLDEEIVCADGGALAYGHPWAASGAVLIVRLLHRLAVAPEGSGLGLAACAIGGGQAIALLVERVG